ncbi:hypothetical protein ARMGADRAFT_1144083 [Armillaria gallica]|uniref:Uncharacterized protein n=1 Tax=Armillaria gallica TaxID=47427 RepID=A0A2H3D266_ARMGA|nr:hypothetical protein ARMGADRAFT_1144083 [Armillaria gallica]
MPAELTDSKVKRRTRRKGTKDFYNLDSALAQEVEDRHSRGELCACRYPILCPLKSFSVEVVPPFVLTTGQGTHFVLAATKHLHWRVARLTGHSSQIFPSRCCMATSRKVKVHPVLMYQWPLQEVLANLGKMKATICEKECEHSGSLLVQLLQMLKGSSRHLDCRPSLQGSKVV